MNAQTLVVVVAAAVVLGSALLVTTLTAKRVVPMLSGLFVLAISPLALPNLGMDGPQKAAVAVVLVLVLLRHGAVPRRTPLLAVAVLSSALLFSLLPVGGLLKSTPDVAVRAFAGYLLPWLFLFVRWPAGAARSVLRVAQVLPICTLPLGLVLQAAGVWPVVSTLDGSPRLQGSSIPAHLALMTVAAVFAAALELVLFPDGRKPTAWLVVNLLLMLATLTRGAALAGIMIVLGLLVWSFTRDAAARPRVRRGIRWGAAALGLLVVAAVPLLLARSAGNSYEGAFNTSGREQAWPFFLSLANANPLTGRGLGFGGVAQQLLSPAGVQRFTAPHNEYLHFYVDGGILLALGFAAVLLFAFVAAFRAAPVGGRIVLAAAVPALLIYAAVDNPFSTPQFSVPFVLALSAVLAARRRDPDRPAAASPAVALAA